MKFRPLPADVPVLGITENGSDMMLTIAYVGVVAYDRKDSEALAKHLEEAAKFVRKQA